MLFLWYVAAQIFNFMGAPYLSPTSLVDKLPLIFKNSAAPEVIDAWATPSSVTDPSEQSGQAEQQRAAERDGEDREAEDRSERHGSSR